jgi:probable HAF family extracellular repeat protein
MRGRRITLPLPERDQIDIHVRNFIFQGRNFRQGHSMNCFKAAGIAAFVALIVHSPVQAADWSIVNLGTLGGTSSSAAAINNRGQVVGTSAVAGDINSHAFLYSNGRIVDLGTLGGPTSSAAGINDAGEVVGESMLVGGNVRHAFLYSRGKMADIGTLGGENSSAAAINNRGQIVGTSQTNPPDFSCFFNSTDCSRRAFLYHNGRMIDLGTLGGPYSYATAINNKGEVIGASYTTQPPRTPPRGNLGIHPFLYRNGKMIDLGTLGGVDAEAYAINDKSQVVGWSNTNPPDHSCPALTADCSSHAWLLSNGRMTDLGTLGGLYSAATSINNRGQVVGTSTLNGIHGQGVFLLIGGKMTDLNALPEVKAAGWSLARATDINELGQVGYGTLNGQTRAFLLSPLPSQYQGNNRDDRGLLSPFASNRNITQ